MSEEEKTVEASAVVVERKRRKFKKPHPFKGIPRSQWPKREKANASMEERSIVDPMWDEAASVLGQDEIESIRKRAADTVLEERKKYLREQAYITALAHARSKAEPNEKIVKIKIDVPAMCVINQLDETGLTVNGKYFLHDHEYEVPLSLAKDLQYQMFIANRNEAMLGSPSRDLKIRTRADARSSTRIQQIVSLG